MISIDRGAAALLLALLLIVPAYAKSRTSGAGVRVMQKITPFDLPHYKDGRLVWTIRGRVAHILEGGDIILEMPKVHIIAAEGRPGRDITAKRATITDGKDTINFDGDVMIVSTDGTSLRTDRLTWKVKTQTARTDSHVVIKRGNMDLSGDGLDARAKLDGFKIHSNVRLVVQPKEQDSGCVSGGDDVSAARNRGTVRPGKPVTVLTKGSMTFANGVAVFVGRPKVISGNATMICDRLDVHMDAETEAIKKAVAEGSVTVTSEEFNAECGKAVWVPDSDDLQLFTNVVVVERDTANTMRTDLAYLNPEGNRMRCTGPAAVTFYSKRKNDVKKKEEDK